MLRPKNNGGCTVKTTKILLSIILAVFILSGAIYFNDRYEEYRKMERIASLEQVDWDLERIGFWRQNQTAINSFIFVSILLNLAIAGAYAGEKKQKENKIKNGTQGLPCREPKLFRP